MDILGAVVRVLGAVAPQLVAAVEAGATEQGLTASLTLALRASAETARARVDARSGKAPAALDVEAVRLDDRALALAALGRPEAADQLSSLADALRADAGIADRVVQVARAALSEREASAAQMVDLARAAGLTGPFVVRGHKPGEGGEGEP